MDEKSSAQCERFSNVYLPIEYVRIPNARVIPCFDFLTTEI